VASSISCSIGVGCGEIGGTAADSGHGYTGL
jgi:hypothetical protein